MVIDEVHMGTDGREASLRGWGEERRGLVRWEGGAGDAVSGWKLNSLCFFVNDDNEMQDGESVENVIWVRSTGYGDG